MRALRGGPDRVAMFGPRGGAIRVRPSAARWTRPPPPPIRLPVETPPRRAGYRLPAPPWQGRASSRAPAICRHRVLVARRDVTVDFVYSLPIAAPGKPHENMPVKMHPKMRLLLARDFAFQTRDGVAPVTVREPRLMP